LGNHKKSHHLTLVQVVQEQNNCSSKERNSLEHRKDWV